MYLKRTRGEGQFALRAIWALALAAVVPARAAAQLDYRNLDDDRPTLTEDAYPIERYGWEVMLPYHFERDADGSREHVVVAEVTHSPVRNFHLGVKAPLASIDPVGASSSGLELAGVKPYALYNFFTEGVWLPALSLRTDLSLPWGALGGKATRVTVKAIATKSWGLTRAHLNAATSFGGDDTELAAVEPASEWWLGAAVDRTFFRQSALLLAEIYARRDRDDSPTAWVATAGARYQWTPTIVLDLGLSRRLGANGPDLGINVGLTYAFAIAALMPRAPR